MLLEAARRLGVRPGRTVVVEDLKPASPLPGRAASGWSSAWTDPIGGELPAFRMRSRRRNR